MVMVGGMAEAKNIGAALTVAFGANAIRNSNAETEIVGIAVDRVPPRGGDAEPARHDSVVVVVTLEGELAVGETLTLTLEIEDAAPTAPGGATAGTFAAVDSDHLPSTTVLITAGAGGAFTAIKKYNLRLSSLRRFFRANITPAFTAAGGASATNFAQIAISYILGSANVVDQAADWIPGYDV